MTRVALAALLLLAACAPDFRGGTGGPPRTALVSVDNPFWPPECPTCDRRP